MIYLMAAELLGIGGAGYTSALTTTLVSDAPCFLSADDIAAARIGIQAANTFYATGIAVGDINSLLSSSKCLTTMKMEKLEAMELLLFCKLGAHIQYPQ